MGIRDYPGRGASKEQNAQRYRGINRGSLTELLACTGNG